MDADPKGLVHLVDDNPQVQAHLGELLRRHGYEVQAYESAETFLARALPGAPEVLVLDMRLPGFSGLELQDRLQAQGRQLPVIFISGESEAQEVIAGFRAGAVDFLWKPFPVAELLAAIDRALAGLADRERHESREQDLARRLERLTPREAEVMRLMVDGHTNKQIAEIKGIAADTVKKYRAMILEKLRVETLPDLIVMCRGSRLLEAGPPG